MFIKLWNNRNNKDKGVKTVKKVTSSIQEFRGKKAEITQITSAQLSVKPKWIIYHKMFKATCKNLFYGVY